MNEPLVLDSKMETLFALLARLSSSTLPLLVLGETGSGKEVVAEAVHRRSPLAARPLLRINCAGLTEALIESELFGHEKGAFTGAVMAHKGLFEEAHGGTLFLDEVAELPLAAQAKLLRVLESGEFMRVGSTQRRQAQVRIVAATHRHLPRLVERGSFREDLYFRLNAATVHVPPLRERRVEIIPLARLFLRRAAARSGLGELQLAADAEPPLLQYAWPGNLRELRNVMECAAAMATGGVVRASDLRLGQPLFSAAGPRPEQREAAPTAPVLLEEPGGNMRSQLLKHERGQIVSALEATGGNQTLAARALGISRRTLTNKLDLHGLDRPRKRLAWKHGSPPPGVESSAREQASASAGELECGSGG